MDASVNYKMRYIPTDRLTAKARSNQKSTTTASLSQLPTFPNPYSTMLIRIVPNETTNAGTNRDSVGCVKEALKVYGYKWNRIRIKAQIRTYNTIFSRKKMTPMVSSPWNRKGTGGG